MNNITIGQYIPGNSWLHRLDPRVKILMSIGLLILIFLVNNFYVMLGFLGLMVLITLSSRIPIIKMLNGLKPLLFLMVFTFLLQLIYNRNGKLLHSFDFHIGWIEIASIFALLCIWFFTRKLVPFKFLYLMLFIIASFALQLIPNDNMILANYSFNVYEDGLTRGFFIFMRVVLMLMTTSLLTFTTMNTDINNGLEAILSPLKIIKFPVGILSMLLSLTLRFIPTLTDEANKILKAQASRGVEFSEGTLKQKINQIVSLLVPMFVISFRRADDLANAMEARGFVVGAKRTKLDKLSLHLVDYVAILGFLVITAGVIYAKISL